MSIDSLSFLHKSLNSLAERIPLKELRKSYEFLSDSYKSPKSPLQFSPLICLSYAIARMPATLSVQEKIWKIFQEQITLKNTPLSLVDVGAGPGTILWSLPNKTWIKNLTLVEKNSSFITLSKKIAKENPYIKNKELDITYIQQDISTSPIPSADIIFASYWLNEMKHIDKIIENIWQAAEKYIIIIEPGTPLGFKNILKARQFFINKGALIIAPCPGNISCPLKDHSTMWCHFRTRLPRHKNHAYIKSANLSFEEEPYSYLIVQKKIDISSFSTKNRIISSVKKTKLGAETLICTSENLQQLVVLKKEKASYKHLLKKKWGDSI